MRGAVKHHEDLLLGRVAVQDRLCTQEQVDECRQLQDVGGAAVSLGDLLLVKGYLSKAQLRELLAKEHRIVMRCVACGYSFTVLRISGVTSLRCPKCRIPIGGEPFHNVPQYPDTGRPHAV